MHFAAPLYTVCVFSKTEHEPQGGEPRERRTCRTLIRSLLIHGICPFEDGTRVAGRRVPRSAELVAHSFEAYLLTEFALSKTEHEPQGGEHMSAELDEQYENAWHSVA